MKVSHNTSIRYVLPSVLWYVCSLDENNGVGAFDDARQTLHESAEFLSICGLPGVMVFGVSNKLVVLH